jgi:YesN/AraC family two-component response regulator
MMPEMDGIEFCKKIRSNINTSHIPIILLTALDSLQFKIKGLQEGADDYIEKPFDFDHLKARIDNLLRNRNLLKKKYLEKPEKANFAELTNMADKTLMEKTMQVVLDHYSDSEFSVESLCKLLAVSRPVLYRKLKAYTDQSPQDFIKVIRLKKAEELILFSGKSVKEIAYEVGFSDPKYFSVSFKKYFGKSPREFIEG